MTVLEKAYAKINLYLDVTGRREDGFHNIVSIMHSVSLCDLLTVSVEPSDDSSIFLVTDEEKLPTDENNLVFRSASAYLSYFDIKAKIKIDLEKHIPIGAGLGGGSSDAAATLRAMNQIFKSADQEQLLEIAERIGSDVPFCLFGGLSLCMGRGERFESLSVKPNMTFVIAIGKERVSTPSAYKALDMLYDNFKDSGEDKVASLNEKGIKALLIGAGENIPAYNIFEQVVMNAEIEQIKKIMIKNRAECVSMSGSGPSVFGKFACEEDAKAVDRILTESGFAAFICHSVYPEANI